MTPVVVDLVTFGLLITIPVIIRWITSASRAIDAVLRDGHEPMRMPDPPPFPSTGGSTTSTAVPR